MIYRRLVLVFCLTAFVACSADMEDADYFRRLGLPSSASIADAKNAFANAVSAYHDHPRQLLRAREAYEFLTLPTLRAETQDRRNLELCPCAMEILIYEPVSPRFTRF